MKDKELIRTVYPYSQKKEVYTKFKKHKGQLYYKVSPI